MANWDGEFDLKPKGTDLVGEMDDYIRATRQEVRIRMAKEHLFDLTSPTTQGHQGLARMGSARVWFSDTEPATATPASDEADNDGTSGRLWVVTSSGTPTGEIKVYSGSAWVSMGSFAPAALLTAIKTVDGSGSGLDADLVRATTPGTGGLALLALSALGTNWTTALAQNAQSGAANLIDAKTVAGINPVAGNSGTYGTVTIGEYSSWTVPAGLYSVTSNDSLQFQIKDTGTTWRGGPGYFSGGMILSDGVNFRLYNSGGSTTLYYRKLA